MRYIPNSDDPSAVNEAENEGEEGVTETGDGEAGNANHTLEVAGGSSIASVESVFAVETASGNS